MREAKFWNGNGYPSTGELYIDESISLEEGSRGKCLCYTIGKDFTGDNCFQVLMTLVPNEEEKYLYDAYVSNMDSSKFSIANQTHLDLYYKSISY